MSPRIDPEVPTDQARAPELFVALRDNEVLGTFLSLPKDDQANFIRWLGAIDSEELRDRRTETFIVALQQSPLADSDHQGAPDFDLTTLE